MQLALAQEFCNGPKYIPRSSWELDKTIYIPRRPLLHTSISAEFQHVMALHVIQKEILQEFNV